MKWSFMPFWLKGAIIASIIYLVDVALTFISLAFGKDIAWVGLVPLIASAPFAAFNDWLYAFLSNAVRFYVSTFLLFVEGLITFFVLGAFIGWLVSLAIKKRG